MRTLKLRAVSAAQQHIYYNFLAGLSVYFRKAAQGSEPGLSALFANPRARIGAWVESLCSFEILIGHLTATPRKTK